MIFSRMEPKSLANNVIRVANMPLPNAFPKEAAKVLLGVATGTEHTTSEIVTASYDLVGYGLFLGYGDGQPLIADDQESIELKAQLMKPETLVALGKALPPGLQMIILALIQKLIERWVK